MKQQEQQQNNTHIQIIKNSFCRDRILTIKNIHQVKKKKKMENIQQDINNKFKQKKEEKKN